MGSYLINCNVTQQVISEGALCRITPIAQDATYDPVNLIIRGVETPVLGIANSNSYCSSFWKPVALGIEGKYNDYGSFLLVFNPYNRAKCLSYFSSIRSFSPPVIKGASDHERDSGVNFEEFLKEKAQGIHAILEAGDKEKDNFYRMGCCFNALDSQFQACWEYIETQVDLNRIFLMDPMAKAPRQLKFHVVHEKAYQALIEMQSTEVDREDVSHDPETYLRHYIKKGLEASENEEGIDGGASNPLSRLFAKQNVFREEVQAAFERSSQRGIHLKDYERSKFRSLIDLIGKVDFPVDYAVESLLPVLLDRYVEGSMEEMNLRYAPFAKAGQDYDNCGGSRYARFVAGVSRQVSREIDELSFGDYKTYSLVVADRKEILLIQDAVREADGRVDLDSIQTMLSSSGIVVEFDCTLEFSDLKDVVSTVNTPSSMSIAQSLSQLSNNQADTNKDASPRG